MQSKEHVHSVILSELSCGLLEGAEASEARAHVAVCPVCQERLESLRQLDALLHRVGDGPPIETVDTAYAQARAQAIQARDVGRVTLPAVNRVLDRRWSGRSFVTAASAIAASVLLVSVHLPNQAVSPAPGGPPSGAEPGGLSGSPLVSKGVQEPDKGLPTSLTQVDVLPPALSFSVLDQSGVLSRGRRDDRYASADQLYFRVDLPSAGHLLLLHLHDDTISPLMPEDRGSESIQTEKGAWELAKGSQLLSLPLSDLAGYHRFVVLFANRPFGLSAHLREALLTGVDATSIYRIFGLRMDGFQIQVRDEAERDSRRDGRSTPSRAVGGIHVSQEATAAPSAGHPGQ